MYRPFCRLLATVVFVLLTREAHADWVAAATTDINTDGFGLVAEYHWPVQWNFGRLEAGWGVAGRIDEDRDAWFGAGLTGEYRFAEKWYVDMSFMPGLYHRGETDLGGTVHFRSMIGLGYDVNEKIGLSFTLDHLSNGSIQTYNPGAEAWMFRIKFRD